MQQSKFSRPCGKLRLRPKILFACEGKETEKNYINSFRLTTAEAKAIGHGSNSQTLLRKALKYQETSGSPFEEIWCIFDKDNIPSDAFNKLIKDCGSSNVKVAFSNPSFELWVLLHFEDPVFGSEVRTEELITRLNQYFPKGYSKNDPNIYDYLQSKQDKAIQRASELNRQYPIGRANSERNPFTTMHLLVNELNSYRIK